ncbi:hypothetical protein [Alienimonas sp. DA493]|uniref:hypothetical protein n=1 Tax=Alienimonas sp. DA493 TaxID=3373605 RepID=UPI003753FAD7
MNRPWTRSPAAVAAAAGLAGAFALGAYFAFRADDPPLALNRPAPDPRAEEVTVGGVRRPLADVRRPPRDPEAGRPGPPPGYGGRVPIPADANPNARSVAEALRTGEHPERLSALVPAAPFDRAAYEADPQAYLDVVEPGRVWQSLQPGPDVPRVRRVSPTRSEIEQGESVALRARAAPGAPVTFVSFDIGAFRNRLPVVTVRADDDGLATAVFTATPGTLFDVEILAASPMTSGQLRYLVHVRPPRPDGLEAAAGAAENGRNGRDER